jgi:hypothetical protein
LPPRLRMTRGVGVPNATARTESPDKRNTALSIISRVRPPTAPVAQPDENRRSLPRRVLSALLTLVAAVLVYLALVVPDNIAHHKPGVFVAGGFLRFPLEAIAGGAFLISVPARFRRLLAVLLGLGLGGLAVLKILNAGFLDVLGRRFNPVLDWSLLHDGFNAVTETDGRGAAIAAVFGAILLTVAVLAVVTLAVVRLGTVTARHAGPARRALVALTAVWVALALTGVSSSRATRSPRTARSPSPRAPPRPSRPPSATRRPSPGTR